MKTKKLFLFTNDMIMIISEKNAIKYTPKKF